MNHKVPDDYVRMQKCIQCGKNTGAILLSTKLQSIPEKQAYSDFCDECKKLFETHHFFVTRKECHQGFIKKSAVKRMFKKEAYERFKNNKVIGFEFCPKCDGMMSPETNEQTR